MCRIDRRPAHLRGRRDRQGARAAVTAKVQAAQVEQRDKAIADLQTSCQAATGLVCQVVTFYQGGKYSLYRYKRYTDVRLVMAPEEGISFFGGDPDNFTYPRYDLDLTLLRVYVNDQPLKTEHYLRWNSNGAKEGDLTFVPGNPGSTGRLLRRPRWSTCATCSTRPRWRTTRRRSRSTRSSRHRARRTSVGMRTRSSGLENSQKAVIGYNAGLIDPSIMARKAAFERDFRSRITAKPDLATKYGKAWDNISKAQKELGSFAVLQQFQGFGGGSNLMNLAAGLCASRSRTSWPTRSACRSTVHRAWGASRPSRHRTSPIDLDTEKRLLAMQFTLAQKALPANDPFLAAALGGRSPEVAAEVLVNGTKMGSVEARKALLDGGAAAVQASTDPLIVLTRKINPMATKHAMRAMKLNTTISANVELVGQAIYAAYGESMPPDATFTLRISDGVVQGFPYNGTIAPYRTSFYGLYARSAEFDDKPPFKLPPRWHAARATRST